MEPDSTSEVRRAVEGDAEALQRLWRDHRRWVAAVLIAHKPREAELDDLLQDVALTMVQRIHELRSPDRLRPWLRTVALNAARTAGRRATTRRVMRSLKLADNHPAPAATSAIPDAQRILDIAQRLHPDYAEPLLLRAVRGFSQRQIAETLGLPETTIETRLARARKMVREELEFERDAQSLPITQGSAMP